MGKLKKGKMYQEKAKFVKKYLLPLLCNLDFDIVDAEYVNSATKKELDLCESPSEIDVVISGEWVILTFSNNYTKGINVAADSNLGICKDILKTLN